MANNFKVHTSYSTDKKRKQAMKTIKEDDKRTNETHIKKSSSQRICASKKRTRKHRNKERKQERNRGEEEDEGQI